MNVAITGYHMHPLYLVGYLLFPAGPAGDFEFLEVDTTAPYPPPPPRPKDVDVR